MSAAEASTGAHLKTRNGTSVQLSICFLCFPVLKMSSFSDTFVFCHCFFVYCFSSVVVSSWGKCSQVDTWISDLAFPSLTNVTISSIIWKVETTTVASTPCDHRVKSINMHMYAWELIHFQADRKHTMHLSDSTTVILNDLGNEISFILKFQFSVFLLLPSFFCRNCLASKIILCCFCTKSKSHPPLQESTFRACLIGRIPGGTC